MSYVASNIGGLTKDRVRWRVGDVNGQPQWFLQDEEIEALLSSQVFPDGTVQFDEICAMCAENIGAQCVQLGQSISQRNLKVAYANRASQAFALADRIRNQSAPAPGAPVEVGAIAGEMARSAEGLPWEYDALSAARPGVMRSPFDWDY